MVWLLFSVLVLYLLLLVGIAFCFVYPFRTPIFLSPGFLGTPQEAVEFPDLGTGRVLRGWWVPRESASVVMIYCHGYMMNRAEMAPFAARYASKPIAHLFFDFPAHGSSAGRRSGFGYKERSAVVSAVRFARERHPSAKIVLVGSSMGASASAMALSEDSTLADGLILDSCYDRLSEAITGWWLFLGGKTLRFFLTPASLLGMPLSGVNPSRVVISRFLSSVSAPTLILHGGADTLASPAGARRNFEALCGPKKLVVFEGRNHSESRWEEPVRYFAEVDEFLREHFGV